MHPTPAKGALWTQVQHKFSLLLTYFPLALNPRGGGGGLFSSIASFVEGKMLEQESFF